MQEAKQHENWFLAIHEAAHAVIALRVGGSCERVTIVDDGIWAGRAFIGELSTEQNILVTLAGPAAERMLDYDAVEHDAYLMEEEGQMFDLLWEYAEDNGIELDNDVDDPTERKLQLYQLYAEFQNEVRQLLRANWASIESVAHALIREGTIDESRLRILMFE